MLAEITPGTLINNRYRVQKVLGQGSFGRTYVASDTQRFNSPCVLKEFVPSNTTEYVVRKARELFEREAWVLYQINHPQIPKFIAWFTEEERLFLVQEYIDGKTYCQLLWERQQQGQSFSEAEVTQWLKDLLPVLDYIHGIKIVHRDISLDNIILPDGQSKPVLIDFGLVKQKVSRILSEDSNTSQQSVAGSIVGKYGYAPPEQIYRGQCYPCSDLYALAVTAVVLLTGKGPNLLMDQSLEWQWHSYVNISDHLAQILDKMLAHKPMERYQSAKEVLAALEPTTLAGKVGANLPPKKLQVHIDKAKKERELAQIIESDEFKELEQRANKLRKATGTATESQVEAQTPSRLDSQFLEHCRQELARYIGPVGSFILEDTLAQSPQLTPKQLVEALTAEIPDPQLAREFRNSIKIPAELKPKIQTHQESVSSKEKMGSQPTRLNPQFLEHCQQELSRFVGGMASLIVKDILERDPQLKPGQLVEALAAEIPDPQKAQEFRNSIKIPASLDSETQTHQGSVSSKEKIDSQPARLNSQFLERCRQELTHFVGVMANFILKDVLDQSPQLTSEQLVEKLATEITDPQKAQEFRKSAILVPTTPQSLEVVVTIDPSLHQDGSPLPPTNQAPIAFRLDKESNLIGRTSDRSGIYPEIALDFDSAVSQRHALLLRQPDGTFMVRDINSTNGTTLNGVRLAAMVDVPIKDGDQLTLGSWTRIAVKAVR